MPSLLIHLAISNQYIKKHPNEIKDIEAFHKGSIAPDLNKDFSTILSKDKKIISHHYQKDGHINLENFRHNPNIDPNNDFWKGYYLHLLTDELFYMSDFKKESELSLAEGAHLYQDYQHLASWLIAKYHINRNESFYTKRVLFLSQPNFGKTRYIKKRKLKKFINKLSKSMLF